MKNLTILTLFDTILYMKTCSVEDCPRPYLAKGLCNVHYMRVKNTGSVELAPKLKRGCSVAGCSAPHIARGLCRTHYTRWQRTGNVNADVPVALERSKRTHCPKGHEYNEENTYRREGQRRCRLCNNQTSSEYKRRLQASKPITVKLPILNARCRICSKPFHAKPSEIKSGIGNYCSKFCRSEGKHLSMMGKNVGHNPKLAGANNPSWNGGITILRQIIRGSLEYRMWRLSVFRRDNFTCVKCGAVDDGGKTVVIQADHFPQAFASILKDHNIKSLDDALACEILWDIGNGRTLCFECHKKTPTWGRRKVKEV